MNVSKKSAESPSSLGAAHFGRHASSVAVFFSVASTTNRVEQNIFTSFVDRRKNINF